jgi:hypothetical protein
MANEIEVKESESEHWMNSKWRPMMGWMYMMVCTMDMVVFPILWSLLQSLNHGQVTSQWQPLTLQGAGLFHIAMGAVLGIAAFGRTQEKLGGANNGGIQTGTSYVPPVNNQPSYSLPQNNFEPSYTSSQNRFSGESNFNQPGQPVSATVGFGGKAAPPPASQPLL